MKILKTYTIKELAQILRTSSGHINNLLSQQREELNLPKSIRFGKKRLWLHSEVEKWLNDQMINENKNITAKESTLPSVSLNKI